MQQDNSSSLSVRSSTFVRVLPLLVVGIGALFYCYEYFLRIMPSVMSRQLMYFYHLDGAAFGNLTANYYYTYTPMQLVVGLLLDRYGPRRLLTVACLFCALGSYLFGASHLIYIATMGRIFVGFGSAFAFVGAMKLAAVWLRSDRMGIVSGSITALGMLGAMLGDIVMTRLVEIDGWRWTLMNSAIIGVILSVALMLFIRDKKTNNVAELDTVDDGAEISNSKELVKGLVAALLKPQMWIAGLIGCLLYLSLTVFAELWGIPFLRAVHHLSAMSAASLNTAIFLGWAIGGPVIGIISDRIHQRRLPLMICSVLAFITICVILYIPILSATDLYLLMVLFGIFCSGQVLVFAVGREINDTKLAGTAVALINAFVMLGGMIFQPLIGLFLDLLWHGHAVAGVHVFSVHAYQMALSVLPLCMAGSFVFTLFLKETCQKPAS